MYGVTSHGAVICSWYPADRDIVAAWIRYSLLPCRRKRCADCGSDGRHCGV